MASGCGSIDSDIRGPGFGSSDSIINFLFFEKTKIAKKRPPGMAYFYLIGRS